MTTKSDKMKSTKNIGKKAVVELGKVCLYAIPAAIPDYLTGNGLDYWDYDLAIGSGLYGGTGNSRKRTAFSLGVLGVSLSRDALLPIYNSLMSVLSNPDTILRPENIPSNSSVAIPNLPPLDLKILLYLVPIGLKSLSYGVGFFVGRKIRGRKTKPTPTERKDGPIWKI